MSDRVSAHDRMSEHLARPLHHDDPAVTAARSTVDLARARLHETRRQFIRRECGSADVAAAEAALSRALDQLDHAAATGWRT